MRIYASPFVCVPLQRPNAPHGTFITVCLKNESTAQGSALSGQEDQKLICTSGWMVLDFREEHCDSRVTTVSFRMFRLLSSQQLARFRRLRCRARFSPPPPSHRIGCISSFKYCKTSLYNRTEHVRETAVVLGLASRTLPSLRNSQVGFAFNVYHSRN